MNDFKKAFLNIYLNGGMGALSKRDIDALVMHLLDELGLDDGVPLKRFSNQQVSVKLRVPASRIKTLRYEATLKYVVDNEMLAKWKFLEVIAKAKFDADKEKICFIIEDSFTKNWLQGLLKSNGLVFDNSFNSEIVKVDSNAFIDILEILFDKTSVSNLRVQIRKAITNNEKLNFDEIKKEFLKGAAAALGEKTAGAVITGLLALVGG
jgi:hypothetical protein